MNEIAAFADRMGIKFSLTDIVNLISGQPISIKVDPFNEPNVLGKTLTISLAQNAVEVQLR